VVVWYPDHWFYVDDRDQETKATLLPMLQLRISAADRWRGSGDDAARLPLTSFLEDEHPFEAGPPPDRQADHVHGYFGPSRSFSMI
jgi:hypothetical protein